MSGGPKVILDVVFEDGLLFLAVRNIGDEPALDVTTTFNRKLVGLGGTKDVAALPLFANIAFLAPGREIRTLLDSAPSWFARTRSTALTARISFRDEAGKQHRAKVTHDLAIYREIGYVGGG